MLALMFALHLGSVSDDCAHLDTIREGTLADAMVSSQVRLRLIANPHVAAFAVCIDTWDGAVRLFGSVQNETEKAEAGREAALVPTVVRVHNDLRVQPGPAPEHVDDEAIAVAVRRQLAAVSIASVHVQVLHGVVDLSGTVGSQTDLIRSALISRAVRGARAVNNTATHVTIEIPKQK